MQRKCTACGHVENEFTFFCTECGGKTEEYSDSSLLAISSEVEFQGSSIEKELKDEAVGENPMHSKITTDVSSKWITNNTKNTNGIKIIIGVLAVAILLSIIAAGILIRRNTVREDTEIIETDITTASAEKALEEERKIEKGEEVDSIVEKSNSDSSQVDKILFEAELAASSGKYDEAIAVINNAIAEGLYDEMLVTKIQEYTLENDDDSENLELQDDDIDAEETIIQENVDYDDSKEFYGIWCGASKEYAGAEEIADKLKASGFEADILITTDWDNLNAEQWYVVSAGRYYEEEDAEKNLPSIKEVFGNAYIKFTGKHK